MAPTAFVMLKTLLIANRGEIAVRLIRTAKLLGIRTISIYTTADATSLHVGDADQAVRLHGPDATAYLDSEQIVAVAKAHGADAIIPGYGFLSENSEFARLVQDAGLIFVGPSPKVIDDFGIKHRARALAIKAGVPVVPGSSGLVDSEEEAVTESQRLGFPVMMKATAGGGGMGIVVCRSENEIRSLYPNLRSRAESLFKDSGVFIEKYFPRAHHIEVQVFGNGIGQAIHFGERECSIQRRNQKVVEECPSPFVESHPGLREKLCEAAVKLAESVKYGSAGTVEYLVDDETAEFFFLEMNTRLQVEHGITEMVYSVDLVELMLKQAESELLRKSGKAMDVLKQVPSIAQISGFAIEARVYAENPAADYAPSPGLLQEVSWSEESGSRIDTWVHSGTKISTNYDPLLAKLITHAASRNESIDKLSAILKKSRLLGPPTNLDFLASILADQRFQTGQTLTSFLADFQYIPSAIQVIAGGSYTMVQDWPGRPTIGRGFGHSGPMDPLSFRIANILVGNDEGTEGLEMTLSGPTLKFLCPSLVAVCGAPMDIMLDGKAINMWQSTTVQAGQILKVGRTNAGGCRAYLAVRGGFPSIAVWFESKSTAPMTGVGGYQGRPLAAGDMLSIQAQDILADKDSNLHCEHIPEYPSEWRLHCMPGPYEDGFLAAEFIEEFYSTTFEASHNANRGGIRLIGPKPRFARKDGGDGGSHPSNIIEYGYAVGSVNWTGDNPCLFAVDAPDFGGFICSTTVIKADWWRMGQMKSGDKVRFVPVNYRDALSIRISTEKALDHVHDTIQRGARNVDLSQLFDAVQNEPSVERTASVFHQIPETDSTPLVSYRQGGDDFVTIDYGHGSFDLNYRCRAVSLYRKVQDLHGLGSSSDGALLFGMPSGNSLTIHFNSLKLDRSDLLGLLTNLETELGDLSNAQFPGRKFRLPICFGSKVEEDSIQRYIDTTRPYASYLPDPLAFVAANNGITLQELKDVFTKSSLMVLAVGFYIAVPIALPIDPRQRVVSPKMNPSRIHTPEGQIGWGGSCMALYNVESPGGYMNTGLSVPGADILGFKKGYSSQRPWLFDDFDQITFYEVTEQEREEIMGKFHSGHYEYEYEEVVFDMAEHNKLLEETAEEVKEIRSKQKRAQAKTDEIEAEMLERWEREKLATQLSSDTVEELLKDPNITAIEAPTNANVWKIEVAEGDRVTGDQLTMILEAMKLEISVNTDPDMPAKIVERILAKPGDVVQAGKSLILLRSPTS